MNNRDLDFNRCAVKVKYLRVASGLTQTEMAKRIDMSLRNFQRVESGESVLDLVTLSKVLKVFDIELHDFTKPYPLQNIEDYAKIIHNIEDFENLLGEQKEEFNEIVNSPEFQETLASGKIENVVKISTYMDSPLKLFVADYRKAFTNEATKVFTKRTTFKADTSAGMENSKSFAEYWDLLYSQHSDVRFISFTMKRDTPAGVIEIKSLVRTYLSQDNHIITVGLQLD